MPGRLSIGLGAARSGLTIYAQLYGPTGAASDSYVLVETGTTGFYSVAVGGGLPAGLYSVVFTQTSVSGPLVGNGTLDWDGTTERSFIDSPSTAQFEARTLPSANYFDPATDTVANVTTVGTVTNAVTLPSIPANWITAAGVAADAVAEIQAGLATASAVAAIPTNPLLASAYVAPLTTLQTTGAVNDALVAYAAAKALPAIR